MQSSRGPPKCDWYADDWDCTRQMANCWLSRLKAKVARTDQRVPADGDAKVMRTVKIDFCYVEHSNDYFWARGDDSWSESATKFWQFDWVLVSLNFKQHRNHWRADNVSILHRFFLSLKLCTFYCLHISNSSEPPQHQKSAQKKCEFLWQTTRDIFSDLSSLSSARAEWTVFLLGARALTMREWMLCSTIIRVFVFEDTMENILSIFFLLFFCYKREWRDFHFLVYTFSTAPPFIL